MTNVVNFEYLTLDEVFAKAKLYARLMDYGHNVQKIGIEVSGSFKRMNGGTLEIEWSELYLIKAYNGQDHVQIMHEGKWENMIPLIGQIEKTRIFER